MKTEKLRIYKLKNPAARYLCALCGAERENKYKKSLTAWNYFQIAIIAILFTVFTSPLWDWKGIFILPIVWIGFEITLKMLFRKELPCPHCGFDPVWYCKDVRIARKKVESFWSKREENDQGVEKVEENQ